ncbi:MAG: TAXI family TRAP transporter solute-binding subunit [Dehalococcoidales bacterium]|nr:TAXI family TRAP transporter solute-binding subunit [Dehalococcoidales bacterium]
MRKVAAGFLLLILLLAISLITIGCNSDNQDDGNGKGGTQESALLMATGSTGGTYYPLGSALADTWNRHIDNTSVSIRESGGSVENIRLLNGGEVRLAMVMNGTAQEALKGGSGDFPEALDNFAAVGVIYPEVMQVFALKSSGIKTIGDLRGKKVSIGPSGSGTAPSALKILTACGLEPGKDIEVFNYSFSDAADNLVNNQLDAAFAVLAIPAAGITEISATGPISLLGIDGDGLKRFLDTAPAFSPFVIPAGTYNGQDEITHTVSQWAVLYTLKDTHEDTVYNLTKYLYEASSETAEQHACGNQIRIENATKGISPVPLHPGAVKYYTEKGIPLHP